MRDVRKGNQRFKDKTKVVHTTMVRNQLKEYGQYEIPESGTSPGVNPAIVITR